MGGFSSNRPLFEGFWGLFFHFNGVNQASEGKTRCSFGAQNAFAESYGQNSFGANGLGLGERESAFAANNNSDGGVLFAHFCNGFLEHIKGKTAEIIVFFKRKQEKTCKGLPY